MKEEFNPGHTYNAGRVFTAGQPRWDDAAPDPSAIAQAIDPLSVMAVPEPAAPVAAPVLLPVTASVGATGDVAMNAPAARNAFHVTGAGIKIGIISDSFAINSAQAAQEEANGDLPSSVTVLKDSSIGNDEGRAMAELVHQVAPGAQLFFSTAEGGEQTFANSILALQAAGCTIIVDDISYFFEPFFQDGNVIQSAVESVTAAGVSYFTAAGNEGANFYEAAINVTSGGLPDGSIGLAQRFTDGSDLQSITIAANATVYLDLQWDQPFRSTNGSGTGTGAGSAYSLELLLFSGATIVASATSNLIGSDPVQVLQFSNPSATATSYNLAIVSNGARLPSGTLKYVIFGNATINDSAAGQGSGTVIGHALVGAANTVGAAYAGLTSSAEPYSSVGPGSIEIDAAGTRLATPIIENKVNFVAPDGIATSVSTSTHSFASFFGTSAAAPNAAAVGALMQQANPNLTPGEITAAIAATATPMADGVSKDGAGFINADAAVAAAYGDAWATAGGGTWPTSSGWTAGTPSATTYVTLSDDLGALSASYTIVVNTAAAASTVTVGNAATIAVGLSIAAAGALTIAGAVTVGQGGSVTVAGAGSVTAGALTGAGVVTVAGTLSVAAELSVASVTLAAGGLLTLTTSNSGILTGGLTSVISHLAGQAARIDLPGLSSADTLSYSSSTTTLSIRAGAITVARLHFKSGQGLTGASFTRASDGAGGLLVTIACFCRGTRIATQQGLVLIEALRIGDPVLTADGRARPIRWIGRCAYPAALTVLQPQIRPIRIRANALGDGLPFRDLLVSPEHALLLPAGGREVLVPARCLVNGVSIKRTPGGEDVDYFHIELPNHAAIMAEGAAAETFTDHAGRAMFANAHEFASRYPGPAAPRPDLAPRVTEGAEIAALRIEIDARAGLTHGPLSGTLERADAMSVAGWARDHGLPETPVILEIIVGARSLGTVVANQRRADLDGDYGFVFTLPAPLDPTRPHVVTVRRVADGALLPGAPLVVGCAGAFRAMLSSAVRDRAAMATVLLEQIDRRRKGSMFFFEKENRKTFIR